MNIGIDVDGVLADMMEFQLKYGIPYFKRKFKREIISSEAYDVRDIFGCTDRDRKRFGWEKFLWTYMVRYPAREGASEVIRRLKREGHRIYIITGRVFVTQSNFVGWLSRTVLKSWLKRRDIPYDDIFFCDEHNSVRDKTLGCKKYRIDVMVEDKPENVMALSKITKVICFDCAYNIESK